MCTLTCLVLITKIQLTHIIGDIQLHSASYIISISSVIARDQSFKSLNLSFTDLPFRICKYKLRYQNFEFNFVTFIKIRESKTESISNRNWKVKKYISNNNNNNTLTIFYLVGCKKSQCSYVTRKMTENKQYLYIKKSLTNKYCEYLLFNLIHL